MLKIAHHSCYEHPLAQGHRFPMEKYELIPQQLIREGTCTEENFFEPHIVNEKHILAVHTLGYLNDLKFVVTADNALKLNGTEAAKTAGWSFEKIDKLFLATGKYNEKQLKALLKNELQKGTISKKDYDALMMISKQDIQQMRAALQQSKVSVTIKAWIDHPENIKSGDAKNISKALGQRGGMDEKFKQ
jgi:acetoin utilization deacetylase AcuC-like enzyme